MMEFITFKRMLTPILIQIVFWLAVVVIELVGIATLIGGILQIGRAPTGGLASAFGGIAIILFGPIVARIYAEILIVIFRINETLTELSDALSRETRGVPQP
jgi:hypothetical protein